MFKLFTRSFSYQTKELKDSFIGTAKEIVKDAKKVTAAATQTLQDDFHSIGQAVATASERINQTLCVNDKENFHAAEKEDKKFILPENPLNKAEKVAHDTKDNMKRKMTDTMESIKEKINNSKEKIKEKLTDAKDAVKHSNVEQTAENIIGKGKFKKHQDHHFNAIV